MPLLADSGSNMFLFYVVTGGGMGVLTLANMVESVQLATGYCCTGAFIPETPGSLGESRPLRFLVTHNAWVTPPFQP